MMNLFGANQVIRLVTSSAANLDIIGAHITYDSLNVGTKAAILSTIGTAATTTIVSAAGSGNTRSVYSLSIRNRHASLSNTLTLQIFDGTDAFEIFKVTLAPGEQAMYDSLALGWRYFNAQGMPRTASSLGTQAPTQGIWSESVLAADVVNNNAVANSIADITGLSFPVLNGLRYRFRFTLDWISAINTTGARFSINGPAITRLAYSSRYGLTATTETLNQLAAYDLPAAANASPANVAGNIAVIEGFIQPAADGNVIGRFASEVASSAITVKAGSMVEWKQVL